MGLLSTIGAASGRAFGFTRSAIAQAVDAYFNLTTLLLPGNGTNGAQNNTFLDSSTNNFTITRNGNTTQGTFSPFSQTGWSAFFNGTSAYASVANNAAFDFGTGDFTVEFWFYATAPAADSRFLSNASYLQSGIDISWESGQSRISWYIAGTSYNTGTLPALNTWHHIAFARSGTTFRVFLNGALANTYTNSTNITSANALQIAIGHNLSGLWNGYISNLRIVKGAAVYTSAFTPSTTPLGATSGGQNPPTGTQTSLLTCQSNRFVDNGGLATPNTVTTTNAPSVQAFEPFAPGVEYSAATVGGSGYFDGTGDYLSVANNAALNVGSGDFCIEAWFNVSTVASQQSIVSNAGASGSDNTQIDIVSGNIRFASSATVWLTGSAVTTNTWNHVVLSRSGTTMSLFLNGSRQATATNSTNFANANNYATIVGGSPPSTALFTGYISNVRIVKGSSVYDPTQTTLTVPTAPLTAITNTSLLANFTNAGITDATAKNDLETVGNAQISTTQSKFGGSSMYFDGTGDYLTANWNPGINVGGSTTWTIEFWGYVGAAFGTYCPISMNQNGTIRWGLEMGASSTNLVFSNATSVSFTHPSTLATNTWFHYAITRDGTTTRLFINGVVSSTTSTNNLSSVASGTSLFIGRNNVSGFSFDWNGYIDDLRITIGQARYTANFTAPTTAFPLQ